LTFPRQHYSIRSRDTAQSIPDSTWTTLNFTTTEQQIGITGSGSNFTTAAASGVYLILASVGWVANGVGLRGIRIVYSGSFPVAGYIQGGDNTAGQTISVACIVQSNSSVTWSAQAYQSSGGALNTAADATLTKMSMIKIA
jgi:hypothetical protein